jgi:hypothetical protein
MNHTYFAGLIALLGTAASGLAAPANDNFANAIALPGNNGSLAGYTNLDATFEAGEPVCFYPETSNTVWFQWTCTEAGTWDLSTKGSTNTAANEWDAVLGVYTGEELGSLTQIKTQDTVLEEAMRVAVTPGTYFIQAGGWGDATNAPDVASNILLTWTFTPAPPNVPEVISVDVVRSDSSEVSGDVAGSPVTGQTGAWNRLVGSAMPATLSGLTDGAGGVTGVGLTASASGRNGFQGAGGATGVVLAGDNPERLWVSTNGKLTLTFTGLNASGNYGLVIYNTGSSQGVITINDGSPHAGFAKIFTSSEVADGSGNITAVVSFSGPTEDDYMEVSGLQIYPLTAPPALAANAGADRALSLGTPSALIGGSPAASGGAPDYTYLWSPADGLDDPTLANPTVTTTTATTTYTLTVTDSLLATATDQVVVTYTVPPLVANAGADQTVSAIVPSVQIGGSPSASGGAPDYTYLWSPADGLDDATAANPIASPTSTTTYTLTVTDSLNTEMSDSVTVTYEEVPMGSADLISIDVVSATSVPVSGEVSGGLTGQSGPWNKLVATGGAKTLSELKDGSGALSAVGFQLGSGYSLQSGSNPTGTGVVLASNNPERMWITGATTLTFKFTGLSVGATYDLAIFNTGSPKTILTINDTPHTAVPTILTTTEVADGNGEIVGVASFDGAAHLDYTELSGFQLKVSGAVPAGYDAWASTNAGGQTPDLDYDHDGVANGVEYFMGAVPGFTANPSVVTVGGVRTVTWPRDPAAPASFKVQVSDNLSAWFDVEPPNESINESNPNQVTYTLPGGAAKKFCRLVVTP